LGLWLVNDQRRPIHLECWLAAYDVERNRRPLAEFTGKIIKIEFDLKPDLTRDHDAHREAQLKAAMIKQ
jgi:hypothetical protein